MRIATLTTVGCGDVVPLTADGSPAASALLAGLRNLGSLVDRAAHVTAKLA